MPDKNKFLFRVAQYYCRTASKDSLAKYVFVVPNRRSGLFLKMYFINELAGSKTPVMMPRFVTVGRLMADLSGTVVMDPQEQLFLLYKCYTEVLESLGSSHQNHDFDRFAFWGDIILSDFNDIDSSLADAEAVFRNLKGVKEIASDFLTDQQKEIVRHLWGESQYTIGDTERFWLHLKDTPVDQESEMCRQFIQLWEVLGPLYSLFKKRLMALDMTTEGGQQRMAADSLKNNDDRIVGKHYVFTGLSSVTNAEFKLMHYLHERGIASFFWDIDVLEKDHLFTNSDSGSGFSVILHRLQNLSRQFPMPYDFEPIESSWPDEIECIGVPSNTAQAKCVNKVLSEWFPDFNPVIQTEAERNDLEHKLIDTAVVLPDEYMILPTVMSIPKGVSKLNVSIRLPYNVTPFASLLSAFVSMQMRARMIHGEYHFYFEDVERIMSHEHIRLIASEAAAAIIDKLRRNNMFNIHPDEIVSEAPALEPLFRPVKNLDNVAEIHHYMVEVISTLSAQLKAVSSQPQLIEYKMLDYFQKQISHLYHLVEKYDVSMSEGTYFTLFERLLSNRRIELHGSPLCGLQVLGVLETRALDFDRLIIMSMNEKIFPKRNYQKTMIPNSLRLGYGLPTASEADGEYTYYFYRMIAGAKVVKIFYDSRKGAFGAGEPSRFISQLRNLFSDRNIRLSHLVLDANTAVNQSLSVDKNKPDIQAELQSFLTPGGRYLSASALKTYKRCSLAFYLQYLRGISDEKEMVDYLDSASYGTIMHSVFEKLLSPFEGKMVNAEDLKAIVENNTLILDTVIQQMLEFTNHDRIGRPETYRPLTSENKILARVITHFVIRTLELEIDRANDNPFRYIKGEKKISSPQWNISSQLSVNFKMVIDRVDAIADGHLRFIDYKTGNDATECRTFEEIFTTSKYDAIFQLLVYCEAYNALIDGTTDIQPIVYPFVDMIQKGRIPDIIVEGESVFSHRSLSDRFLPRLKELIAEIFDVSVPFVPADNTDACKYCQFTNICGR